MPLKVVTRAAAIVMLVSGLNFVPASALAFASGPVATQLASSKSKGTSILLLGDRVPTAVWGRAVRAAGARQAGASAPAYSPWYAYAGGGAIREARCPETALRSKQCSLGDALSLARGGGTVMLATPGSARHYVGNWVISALHSSSSTLLTIRPAPGVANPTLDGNHGKASGCQTRTCNGPVLTLLPGVHLDLDHVTVENANNTATPLGGAIDNDSGGTIVVSTSTFLGNTASGDGGAIDNGDGGQGTAVVSDSTFSGNSAGAPGSVDGYGGAIDNGNNNGRGALTVTGSTFSGNVASNRGGAIDNGDDGGQGTAVVSDST
ncbi:MAG TPA: hypothetical protein VME46_17000, partial [Acidimicrobiales bacterium]|nr:hypothetical protein [Acidimicrobiales bacterium]